MHLSCAPSRPRPAAGYTLVELLIALLIALFLLAGLLTIVQSTRQTYNQQSSLAQLQDSERLASILMGDIIQAAGYFPSPTTNTSNSEFPAVGTFTGGQVIVGTQGAGTPGNTDTISVRFTPPTIITSDANVNTNLTVINCTGTADAVGTVYTNTFYVDGSGNLDCTLSINGVAQTPVQLIGGVQNLQIWYGVATQPASGNNVDTYLTAAEMTAANWGNVTAVKVRLTFANPLACQTAVVACSVTSEPALNYIERVVGVMAKTGVTT
ncbi:MAG TPA: PilW family protein [Steroidobacteraceae bacterium]|nr:PilW family protein [Steroidobacteraceae bacterium]